MFRFRHPDIHQEEDVIPWGRVIAAFLAMVAVAIVMVVLGVSAGAAAEARVRPSGVFPERDLGPRHQVGVIQEALFDDVHPGQRIVESQREELSRFGVVDREKGIVSIPIDAAIRLVVEESKR
jgi:hypothetical protein